MFGTLIRRRQQAQRSLGDDNIAFESTTFSLSIDVPRPTSANASRQGLGGPPLRHCFEGQQSLSPQWGSRKPNDGGLFAPDLLTGVAVTKAIWLSLPPFLSKPADSRF